MTASKRTMIAILVLGIGGIGGFFIYQHVWPADPFLAGMAKVKKCAQLSRNAPLCAQPAIRSMLDVASGTEIIHTFEKQLTPAQCHYMGHVVGQQSYIKYQGLEKALAQCDNTCESSCIHGAVGEAFEEELGVGTTNLDLKHLSAADIERIGTQLCKEAEPCHGVGHVLFQAYLKFAPALEECQKVASPENANFCFGGVFMEYADQLNARSLHPTSDVGYPRSFDLPSFCTSQKTIHERRACFLYFPRVVWAVIGGERDPAVARTASMCETYDPLDRSACFAGIGAFNSYNISTQFDSAQAGCALYPDFGDQASCNSGVITFDVGSDNTAVFAYCHALSTEKLQAVCYQNIFYKLSQRGASLKDVLPYCKNDERCLSEQANYAVDPASMIVKIFPR
ncbi:MAG TPA: hypothetical protein VHD38_00065 [Candidatus Paceibacterota bacterium]|nr:hypothetical protein [Candidatus Paceibacterota bacterium]